MNIIHNPPTLAPPQGAYNQAIEVAPGARWLCTAGQVGVRPDGTMAQDFGAQCEWAFRNVLSLLEAAGMDGRDMVKLDIFMVLLGDFDAYRAARRKVLGEDGGPTGTFLYVPALARPEWLIEVQAWAAQAIPV